MKSLITFLLGVFVSFSTIQANNIQVSNLAITGQNTVDDYSFVKFDLSWENSWRISVGPSNWDAAWVFIKFRINNGAWFHARLNYVDGTNDGHTAPGGVTVNTANSGVGYGLGTFIQRGVDGSGNVNWQNIQLRWNYGLSGVGDNDLVDVQVFAIEMVYVPQGSFYIGGTAGTEWGKFYTHPTTSSSYQISSENAINIGETNGFLYYTTGLGSGDQLGPVPPAYPKGFNAFYCMKYEMSQDQWVSFFNTLTDAQKLNRDITDVNHKNSDNEINRNTVSWSGTGNATTTTPNVPVNYISFADANAYYDWAALRPMSELEFQKACRGPLTPVTNEYAWGNSSIHNLNYTIINNNTQNELITNNATGTGNAYYGLTKPINGPIRCGIFAASAINKNREETGGTYYGIMEMSGSLMERVINLGTPAGRGFSGFHGNGSLSVSGDSNVSGWSNLGGSKGGSWAFDSKFLMVADRELISHELDLINSYYGAGRGVRTAN